MKTFQLENLENKKCTVNKYHCNTWKHSKTDIRFVLQMDHIRFVLQMDHIRFVLQMDHIRFVLQMDLRI